MSEQFLKKQTQTSYFVHRPTSTRSWEAFAGKKENPATCGSCCNYSKRMIKEFKLCNVESERCKESEKEHSVCLSLRDKCYKNVRKNDERRDE